MKIAEVTGYIPGFKLISTLYNEYKDKEIHTPGVAYNNQIRTNLEKKCFESGLTGN